MTETSNFYQNINNQLNRLREIISSPNKLYAHIDSVYNIHDSIEEELKNYKFLSETRIKKDVLDLITPTLEEYKNKVRADVKKHVIKSKHQLKPFNFDNFINEIELDFVDSSVYDDLYQCVEENMDLKNLSTSQMKLIKNYIELKEDIESNYDDLLEEIKRYESKMVNVRQKIFDQVIKNVVPQLYEAHLSYLKTNLDAKYKKGNKPIEVTIDINNITYPINKKQTEFIITSLKQYLDI